MPGRGLERARLAPSKTVDAPVGRTYAAAQPTARHLLLIRAARGRSSRDPFLGRSHIRVGERRRPLTADPTHADQVARDDAHLRSLGIKPELRRTLGFLSNFAVAFSYISVSTGTFTNQAVAFGVGGPAVFWAWPMVILGQTFVALNLAELSSHFPVAGSIYQWSKRLSNKTLGWFTGWIYFWAGVVTVTAVAATVPLVLSTLQGWDLASPSPVAALDMWQFVGLLTLVT